MRGILCALMCVLILAVASVADAGPFGRRGGCSSGGCSTSGSSGCNISGQVTAATAAQSQAQLQQQQSLLNFQSAPQAPAPVAAPAPTQQSYVPVQVDSASMTAFCTPDAVQELGSVPRQVVRATNGVATPTYVTRRGLLAGQ